LPRKLQDIQEELPEQVIKIDDSMRELMESVPEVDGLPDDVRDLARSMTGEFREYLRSRVKTQIEALLPIIDDLKKTMTPSNLDTDLNRQELESMLN
jgi:hypothetical protein